MPIRRMAIALATGLSLIGISDAQADWCADKRPDPLTIIRVQPNPNAAYIGLLDQVRDEIVVRDAQRNRFGYLYLIYGRNYGGRYRIGWVDAQYLSPVYYCPSTFYTSRRC
jgi:hypothetical protein